MTSQSPLARLLPIALLFCLPVHHGLPQDDPLPPQPNEAQREFMALKRGLFIHFGINTFNDVEWSYGDLPLSSFTPPKVDTDQWCRLASAAGMKYVIFTSKHMDGFCNWATEYTDYSVMHTAYGQDIVAQLAASCRKHGLKLGLYYSLWDENHPTFKTDETGYNQFVRHQITELLTLYGDVVCLWFDGFWKRQQHGWSKKTEIEGEVIDRSTDANREERFIDAWRREGAYRWEWDQLYNLIKSLQPNCIVLNNPTTAYQAVPLLPVDARASEKGHEMDSDRKIWSWLGKPRYFPQQIETTLSQKGNKRFPSGNWFWHSWDHSVATKEQVEEWARNADRLDANLVLNVGPSSNGELRPEDAVLLRSLERFPHR